MYFGISAMGNRPLAARPAVTAGFRWQPEMWPIAVAIESTVRPKASDTPRKPMPRSGYAAAKTALPQPPRTSQNVPIASANSLPIECFSAKNDRDRPQPEEPLPAVKPKNESEN